MTVVVLGSANVDLTVRARRLPEAGETVAGTAFAVEPGGKGFNQAVAAARLEAPTAFIGRVGDDDHGTVLLSALADAGIDVTGVLRDAGATSGIALVMVGPDGQNRIIVVGGANEAVRAPDVARLSERLRSGDVLLVQLEIPLDTVRAAVVAADRAGARVVLDPAPVPEDGLPASLYAPHVVLTPNESEGAHLVGHPLDDDAAAERAVRTLLGRGAGTVVLKLGHRGVCWGDGTRLGWCRAASVEVCDTVGAGDALNGALAAVLHSGAGLEEATRWAVAAGTVAVTRFGTYGALPTASQVVDHLVRQDLGSGAAPDAVTRGPLPTTTTTTRTRTRTC